MSSEAAAGSLPPRRAFLAAFGCSGAAALFFLVDGGGGGGGDDDDDGSGSTFSSLWSFTSEIIRVGMWLAPGSTSKVTSALLPLMDVTLPVSPLPPIGTVDGHVLGELDASAHSEFVGERAHDLSK